jgi:hypothetical protein
MDEDATATMITNMYAGSLAAQVTVVCDRARVKATGRRIEASLLVAAIVLAVVWRFAN